MVDAAVELIRHVIYNHSTGLLLPFGLNLKHDAKVNFLLAPNLKTYVLKLSGNLHLAR